MKKVYAITSYDNGGNAGLVVERVYTTLEAAQSYAESHRYNKADRYEIEELGLYDSDDPAIATPAP